MREDAKDRYCKSCGADFLGDKIPEKDIEYFAHKLDDGSYSNTHFDKRIGLYSMERDRTIEMLCHICGHNTWR